MPPVENKPTTETVTINGVKYIVTPEMAKALKAQEETRLKEIEELKKKAAAPPPVVTPAVTPQQPPAKAKYGEKLFEDPDAVLEQHGKDIEERVYSRVKSEYEQERAREATEKQLERFYTEFFSENKELKDDRDLVETIFVRNYQNWNTEAKGDFTILKKKLAEKARDTILRHVKNRQEENPDGKPPASSDEFVFEGGGMVMGAPISSPAKDDSEVKSLGDVIRRRNAARRAKQ